MARRGRKRSRSRRKSSAPRSSPKHGKPLFTTAGGALTLLKMATERPTVGPGAGMNNLIAQLRTHPINWDNVSKVVQSQATNTDNYVPVIGGVVIDWIKPAKVKSIVKRATKNKFE